MRRLKEYRERDTENKRTGERKIETNGKQQRQIQRHQRQQKCEKDAKQLMVESELKSRKKEKEEVQSTFARTHIRDSLMIACSFTTLPKLQQKEKIYEKECACKKNKIFLPHSKYRINIYLY